VGKRKIKFNLLDLLIIVAVGALVAGIIWRRELTQRIKLEDSENTVSVECAFIVTGVKTPPEFNGEVTTVYFSDGSEAQVIKTPVKNVKNDESLPESSYDGLPESSEEYNEAPPPAEILTLRFKAVSKADGYYLEGGGKLFIDAALPLHTTLYEFTALILSISES